MTEAYREFRDAAGPVSRETFDRLRLFESYFLKWARRVNLVAESTLDDVWRRHILDSVQLAAIAHSAKRWLDIGSGGGFPGLVIAFMLAEREGAYVDLVEANQKKAAFLRAAAARFAVPARVHAKRLSDLQEVIVPPEIVTARAVAPLPLLLEMTAPWLTRGAVGLFHKGRGYRHEIGETADRWDYDLVEHASRVDKDSAVLEIRQLRRLDAGQEHPHRTC